MTIYIYQANLCTITVYADSGKNILETFRTGPSFNNRSAPMGIRTTNQMALIDHVARQEQRAFDKPFRSQLRQLVQEAQVGEEIDLHTMQVRPIFDPRLQA